jgi:hypothetical protein
MSIRLANYNRRASLIVAGRVVDVERASSGRFSADPMAARIKGSGRIRGGLRGSRGTSEYGHYVKFGPLCRLSASGGVRMNVSVRRALCALLAVGVVLAVGGAAKGTILYQNNFESPSQDPPADLGAYCPDISSSTVNFFYGPEFQQTNTVETIAINGPADQYSDPSGIGGNYALGMLCCVQNDKVALTFDSQGEPYLNLRMDVSPIDVNGCGGPFGVGQPTFRLTLFDTPSGVFDFNSPGTVLSTVDLVGNAPVDPYTFNWKAVVGTLSTAGSVNGTVTVAWDLMPGSGYGAFDNLVISASDAPDPCLGVTCPDDGNACTNDVCNPASGRCGVPVDPLPPICQSCAGNRVFTLDADFDRGTLLNLNHDAPNGNQLQVNQAPAPFPFVNVAASARGTIVRIDVNTGVVLGEYLTAPDFMGRNPSRTTVDQLGNVWVSNRDEAGFSVDRAKGSVTRVGLVLGGTRVDGDGTPNPLGQYLAPPFQYSTCVDRDGDGLIRTSTGLGNILPWTNSAGFDSNGGVSTAADECIINYTRVAGTATRTVAVDGNNDIWVGGLGNLDHEKLSGVSGLPLPGTQFNLGCGGYGGLLDGDGVLWSARGGTGLLRFDTGAFTGGCFGSSLGDYGLGIDPRTGEIWQTFVNGDAVAKIAPDATLLAVYPHGEFNAQGVAVDSQGNVWVAHSTVAPPSTTVGHLRTDGTFVGNVSLPGGVGPTGVAVDANGRIWVTNLNSDNVMRIDPNAGPIGGGGFPIGAVDLTVDLGAGAGPYNYSDMTGFISIGATSPQGTWVVTNDSGTTRNIWGSVAWNTEPPGVEPPGTSITVEARAADTAAGLPGQAFVAMTNGGRSGLTGRFLELRVTLRASDLGVSPVLSDIRVETGCAATCQTDAQCGDGNPCTTDTCDPSNESADLFGCLHPPSADGSTCDDGNQCTDNRCDGAGQCLSVDNSASCDDGSFCNGSDTCSGGTCSVHGGDPCAGGGECAATCDEARDLCATAVGTPCTDEGNACTDNLCDGQGACRPRPNSEPCDDGDACTTGDACSNGSCSGAPVQCADDGSACNGPETCQAGTCISGPALPDGSSCDDGLFCTGLDTCQSGSCQGHSGDPCPGTECNRCQEATQSCFDPVGTACDIGNPGTIASCDGQGRCVPVTAFAVLPGGATPSDVRLFMGYRATVNGNACSHFLDMRIDSKIDGSAAALRTSGEAARCRRSTEITGNLVTGGGSLNGSQFLTLGMPPPDTTGTNPLVDLCATTSAGAASDRAYFLALPVTPGLQFGEIKSSTTISTLGAPPVGEVVVDVTGIRLRSGAKLTLEGTSTQTVIVRVAADLKLLHDAAIEVTGGLTPEQVLWIVNGRMLARSSSRARGAFYAAGPIRIGSKAAVHGQLLSDTDVRLGQLATVNARRFLGWTIAGSLPTPTPTATTPTPTSTDGVPTGTPGGETATPTGTPMEATPAITPTATEQQPSPTPSAQSFRIGSFDATRAAGSSLSEGNLFVEARAALDDEFPNLTRVGFPALDGAALAGIDILVLASYADAVTGIVLSGTEQQALFDFVGAGGCAILLADNDGNSGGEAANESLLDPFGLDASGTGNSSVVVTVIDPTASPITAGPFGQVSSFSQGFPGGLDNLGAHATSLASNSLGSALAVIESGSIAPGSGRVVIYSDANTFGDGVLSENRALFLNTIQFCLDGLAIPRSIELRLDHNVISAGSLTEIRTEVRTAAGALLTTPVQITVTPLGSTTGPVPSVIGNMLEVDLPTRGSFTIEARVGTSGVVDTDQLTVLAPSAQNDQLRDLSGALNQGLHALETAGEALGRNDLVAAASAKAELQAALDSLNLRRLDIVTPFAPEGGFIPSLSQIEADGFTETADDVSYRNLLSSILADTADLTAVVAALDPSSVTDAQLADLESRTNGLSALSIQLQSLNVTPYGLRAAANELTRLITRVIPNLVLVVGQSAIASMDSVGVMAQSPPEGFLYRLTTFIARSVFPRPANAQYIFDIVGKLGLESSQFHVAKGMYEHAMTDLENMLLLMALRQLLAPFEGTGLCVAASGGFLSSIAPGIPASYLEGPRFDPVPEANRVYFIGPEAPQAARDALDTLINDPECADSSADVFDCLEAVLEPLAGAYESADATPSSVSIGVGFLCTEEGDRLVYDNGFPDVLGSCFVCVSPVIILHYDKTRGWSVYTTIMARS